MKELGDQARTVLAVLLALTLALLWVDQSRSPALPLAARILRSACQLGAYRGDVPEGIAGLLKDAQIEKYFSETPPTCPELGTMRRIAQGMVKSSFLDARTSLRTEAERVAKQVAKQDQVYMTQQLVLILGAPDVFERLAARMPADQVLSGELADNARVLERLLSTFADSYSLTAEEEIAEIDRSETGRIKLPGLDQEVETSWAAKWLPWAVVFTLAYLASLSNAIYASVKEGSAVRGGSVVFLHPGWLGILLGIGWVVIGPAIAVGYSCWASWGSSHWKAAFGLLAALLTFGFGGWSALRLCMVRKRIGEIGG
jgi:hypothetical protein